MERSRSKRNYHYYENDYNDSDMGPRPRPRYNGGGVNRRNRMVKPGGEGGLTVTTAYRILCHDVKAGGVIGKSGSIIKSIRQHTGAWINVHELLPGDEERVIEISDTRRRDPDGRMPAFSPAQEALFLIHERILESGDGGGGGFSGSYMDDEEEAGFRSGGNRTVTRLVVSRMHVGSLLGKGGKIIEQMRGETKTHIRVLPRDHSIPRCVSMSEEIVQIVGDVNAVKNAVAIISSRLRESQHRDRSGFQGRGHSPERTFPPDDDYIPNTNNTARRPSMDRPNYGTRASLNSMGSNNYSSHQSSLVEPGVGSLKDSGHPFYGEDLVFRILCPVGRIKRVVGGSDDIIDLLQNEVGVDVKVADPVAGSNEQIIIISSDEGPDDELFPAQEALLHIQTRIVDLVPDRDNFITTRLLVPSSHIDCLDGRGGSLTVMKKLTGADIQILSRDELPPFISETDELVQITGEIRAARNALVEVTARLRNYIYREFFEKDSLSSAPAVNTLEVNPASQIYSTVAREGHMSNEPPHAGYPYTQTTALAQPSKEHVTSTEMGKQGDSNRREDIPAAVTRFPVPLVTRSTLEVVVPEQAASKLITKSRNKLAQISELSGANVTLVEDRPEVTEKIIRISGTPEQAERAQSLLQGFILSTQEDGP